MLSQHATKAADEDSLESCILGALWIIINMSISQSCDLFSNSHSSWNGTKWLNKTQVVCKDKIGLCHTQRGVWQSHWLHPARLSSTDDPAASCRWTDLTLTMHTQLHIPTWLQHCNCHSPLSPLLLYHDNKIHHVLLSLEQGHSCLSPLISLICSASSMLGQGMGGSG